MSPQPAKYPEDKPDMTVREYRAINPAAPHEPIFRLILKAHRKREARRLLIAASLLFLSAWHFLHDKGVC